MKQNSLRILLTNDDGVEARGLLSLKEHLRQLGEVFVVAPSEEKSAASHSLTIHHPIRAMEVDRNHFALTGTPADCVLFAIRKLMEQPPDLVISGINHGANLGEDILYSGTVAGAREASLHGIPALAVSLVNGGVTQDFTFAAEYTCRLVRELWPAQIPGGAYLNVNIPSGTPNGYRFTRQGSKRTISAIQEKRDPRGRAYYWIGPDESEWAIEADTDYHAIQEGLVSITPLHRDQTDYRALKGYHRCK